MPSVGFTAETKCGDPFCSLEMCEGHNAVKPWYETVRPVYNPEFNVPDPIVLMKQDGWTLEKQHEKDTESNIHHYCTSLQWKKYMCIGDVRQGYCPECYEDIPVEVVGAYTMHNWSAIQHFDANEKKYGAHHTELVMDPDIKVYR
jgi:hypothetical protein